MDYKIRLIRYLYFLSLTGLLFIYLFPGSIFGYIFYGDIKQQPNIISNPFGTSINHMFAFLYLSLLGLFSFLSSKNYKKIILFLIMLSIVLELTHIIIPVRSFQTSDLVGNLLGTFLAIVIMMFYKWWKYGKI